MSADVSDGTSRNPRSPFAVLADAAEQSGFMLLLLGEALLKSFVWRRPALGFGRFVEQLYVQTVKTLLVVTIVGIFTGMVLALQTGEELKGYSAEGQLAPIVAATMAREMGPFITAVILTATVGASIAAELGTMRVSEEIEALEMMNVDPVAFLVTPRVTAVGVSAVVLTVLVNSVGVLGGAVVANAQYGTSFSQFFEGARQILGDKSLLGVLPKDLYTGLFKSFVFGLLIGGLACAAGLMARGGALGVGRAVRKAVVAAIVVNLVVGYLLTWFFWA